jgi:hypothetical protein
MGKSTPGVTVRHVAKCPTAKNHDATCKCEPSYVAWVFDARQKKKRYKTFSGPRAKSEAKGWRADALGAVKKGTLPTENRTTVERECLTWIERLNAGDVRARGGREYKPSVQRQYPADLNTYVIPAIGHLRVSQLQIKDVQTLLVDDMVVRGLSGSRVRGCLNALRAVLRRPLAHGELRQNPTTLLEVPADAGKRERAATPTEVAALIAALPDELRGPLRGGVLRGPAAWRASRAPCVRPRRRPHRDPRLAGMGRQAGRDRAEVGRGNAEGVRLLDASTAASRASRAHRSARGRPRVRPHRLGAVHTDTHHQARDGRMGGGDHWSVLPLRVERPRADHLALVQALVLDVPRRGRHHRDASGPVHGHSDGKVQTRYRHQLAGQAIEDAATFDAYLTGTPAGTQRLRIVAEAHG